MTETLARQITDLLERARDDARTAGVDGTATIRVADAYVSVVMHEDDSFIQAEAVDHDARATGIPFSADQRNALLDLGWNAHFGCNFRRQFGITSRLDLERVGTTIARTFEVGYGVAENAAVQIETGSTTPLTYAFACADMQRAFVEMVESGLGKRLEAADEIASLFDYWSDVLDDEHLAFRLIALMERSSIPVLRIAAEDRLCRIAPSRLSLRIGERLVRYDRGDLVEFVGGAERRARTPTENHWQELWAVVETTGLRGLPKMTAQDGVWELRLSQGSRDIEVAGDLPLPASISTIEQLLADVLGDTEPEPEAEEALMSDPHTFHILEHRFDELVEGAALDPSLSVFERLYARSGGAVSAPVPNEPAVLVSWAVDAIFSAEALNRPPAFPDPDALRIEAVFSPAHPPAVVVSLREPGGEFWLTTGHLDPRQIAPIGTADRASTLACIERVLVHANELVAFMQPAEEGAVTHAPPVEEPGSSDPIALLPDDAPAVLPSGTFPTPTWVDVPLPSVATPAPVFGAAAPAFAYEPAPVAEAGSAANDAGVDPSATSHLSIVHQPDLAETAPAPYEPEAASAAVPQLEAPVPALGEAASAAPPASPWGVPPAPATPVWTPVPAPIALAPPIEIDPPVAEPVAAPEPEAQSQPVFALPAPAVPTFASPIFDTAPSAPVTEAASSLPAISAADAATAYELEPAPAAPPADLWSPQPQPQHETHGEAEPASEPQTPEAWVPAPPQAEPAAESPFTWAHDTPAPAEYVPAPPPQAAPAVVPEAPLANPFGFMAPSPVAAPEPVEIAIEPAPPAPTEQADAATVPFGYVAASEPVGEPEVAAESMSSLLGISIRYPEFVREDSDRHRWDMALLEAAQIFNLPVTANEVQVAAQNIYRGVG